MASVPPQASVPPPDPGAVPPPRPLPSLPLRAGDATRPPADAGQTATRAFLADVQAGILAGAGRGMHVALLFFRFSNRRAYDRNAATLAEAATRVTSAWQQYEVGADLAAAKHSAAARRLAGFRLVTLGLTGIGLNACGIRRTPGRAKGLPGRFPPDANQLFWKGLWEETRRSDEESTRVGSVRYRESEDWDEKFRTRFAGIWQVGAETTADLAAGVDDLEAWCRSRGMKIVHRETGLDWRPDGTPREPFGFADGLSVPRFFDYETRLLTSGARTPPAGEADIRLDELFLTDPVHLAGTFLIYKKFEQNVAAFRATGDRRQEAERVGRFPDGLPLCPAHIQVEMGAGRRDWNDFDFTADTATPPLCPFHSHVRRSNPRGHQTQGNGRARLVRRSWVYGSTADLESPVGVSGGVGLQFMAYVADIDVFRQVNGHWLGAGNHPVPGGDPAGDPLLHGSHNRQRFVTPRGGDYFYIPTVSWLRSAVQRLGPAWGPPA